MTDNINEKEIKDSNNQLQSANYGDAPVGQTPIDPTDNAQGLMNDTTGLTGISKDTSNPATSTHETGPEPRTISVNKTSASRDLPNNTEDAAVNLKNSPPTASPGSTPTGNETLDSNAPPNVVGEQGMNASTPDPASDDDTLANAHNVGLRLDEDEEHPKELDIASDIDKAEEAHRSS